jgi:hypothetical protein
MRIGFILNLTQIDITRACSRYVTLCKSKNIEPIILYIASNKINTSLLKAYFSDFKSIECGKSNIEEKIKENRIDLLYCEVYDEPQFSIDSIPIIYHSIYMNTKEPNYTVYRNRDRRQLPYIVEASGSNSDFRKQYNIPSDAIVFGVCGEISIDYVKNIITSFSSRLPNTYFIFDNTISFANQERMIFLNTRNILERECMIKACDFAIHAKLDGETFGIECSEFAINGVKILTSKSDFIGLQNCNNEHIYNLGEMAILYSSANEFLSILHSIVFDKNVFVNLKKPVSDFPYKRYNTEEISKLFFEAFGYLENEYSFFQKFISMYKPSHSSLLTTCKTPKTDFNKVIAFNLTGSNLLTTVINNQNSEPYSNQEDITLIYTDTFDIPEELFKRNSDIFIETEKETKLNFKILGDNNYIVNVLKNGAHDNKSYYFASKEQLKNKII